MKKILLVEDNPDEELLSLRAIRKCSTSSEVIVARDGQQALDYLFGSEEKEAISPDLVLLDLQLPFISGMEVLRRIRSNSKTKFLMVIILTSSGEEKDLRRAYTLGSNSYIKKPVDFGQFKEVVTQISSYWLELNEAPAFKQ